MSAMNLAYFKSYLAVVKQGGFSEAARTLGLSQPTVSFHIQRLEEEMGAKFLDRHGGRSVVTAAGREFQAFVEKVLHEQLVLKEKLASLQDEMAGTLSLGASTHPGEYILPRIMGAFRRKHPLVQAVVTVADTAVIVDRVIERQCDAALVAGDVKRRGLEVKQIGEDELLLIVPANHPLTVQPAATLEDLEMLAFVVRGEGSGTQKTIDDLMTASGLNPARLTTAMVAGSNQAVISAVEAGVGVAIASQMAAFGSLQLGRMKAVPIEGVRWVRGIYYVQPSRPVDTRILREFAAFLDTWKA